MSRVDVATGGLTAAACRYDAVAGALAQVLRSVRAHGHPDTGRADTALQVADVTDGFVRALELLATAAGADADALRSAATGYDRTDATAMRAG